MKIHYCFDQIYAGLTSMLTNKNNPVTSKSTNNPESYDSNSSDTNFPENVWMDDKGTTPSNSFLGKIFEKKQESVDDVFNVVSNRAMLETEVWKTQMALNDELIAASVTEREEKIKRTVKYEELLEENKQLKIIRSENKARIENLIKENTLVKKNICSLYKTAKAEIEGKDKMIFEINKELDFLRHKIKRWENNQINMNNAKLCDDARNDKTCNEDVENKIVKPISSASKRENDHLNNHDTKLNNVRDDRVSNKAVESKVTKSSHQSSHSSRNDVNRNSYPRKRKRQSPYRSPYSKHRHSYNDHRKTADKASYSYYKRSYGYHTVSPRKNSDKRDLKKYGRTSRASNVDSKREILKTKNRANDEKYEKGLANRTGIHKKQGSVQKKISNNKNTNFEQKAETKIKCSDNNLHTNSKKEIDSTCSKSFKEHDKTIADVVKNLSGILNSESPAIPSTTPSIITASELHATPIVIDAEVPAPLENYSAEEYVSNNTITAELHATPIVIDAEVPAPLENYSAEEYVSPNTIAAELHATPIVIDEVPAPLENFSAEEYVCPNTIVAEVPVSSITIDTEVLTPPKIFTESVPALCELVPASVSALLDSIVAEVSASLIPIASEIPVTNNNSIKTKDTIPFLQNVSSKICSNNNLDSNEQNVSLTSSHCDLISDSECNLNSNNKSVDILEDKTTTNALFFGMLPIEIRRSFMEYEQQLIVNTNKLKQSFVNYYFNHYKGVGPSTHNDDASSNNEPLKECSNNQTSSHNKDVHSSLFFFNEENEIAMSINSNVSPKTLSVDETNNEELLMPESVSQAYDTLQTDPFILDAKTKGVISDNEDAHTDSTKEIDVFHRDVIQKQLNKNNDTNPDLSGVSNLLSSTVAVKLTSVPTTDTDETSTMPISVAKIPDPSVSADAGVSTSSISIVAQAPVTVQIPSAEVAAVVSSTFVDNVPVPTVSVVTEVPDTTIIRPKSDEPLNHVKHKSSSQLKICYRDIPQETYPQYFNSLYSRRQIVKTALKERDGEGLSKTSREYLEKLHRYKNDKKPYVIWQKSKHQKNS